MTSALKLLGCRMPFRSWYILELHVLSIPCSGVLLTWRLPLSRPLSCKQSKATELLRDRWNGLRPSQCKCYNGRAMLKRSFAFAITNYQRSYQIFYIIFNKSRIIMYFSNKWNWDAFKLAPIILYPVEFSKIHTRLNICFKLKYNSEMYCICIKVCLEWNSFDWFYHRLQL